jgi:hypothetical protein
MYTLPEAVIADEIVERVAQRVDKNLAESPMILQACMSKTGMNLNQVREYLIAKALRELVEMRLAK